MPKFGEAEVGETILIWVFDISGTSPVEVGVSPYGDKVTQWPPNLRTISATVLGQDPNFTYLGWKVGDEHPTFPNAPELLTEEWKNQGFVYVRKYGNWVACERPNKADVKSTAVVTRQEKPCQQCQRPNDVGVKSCWWCGTKPN